jgi:uncharacterized damage-inducible protein DinB
MTDLALTQLLYGTGAHANLIACVEDVSSELSGRCIENYPHSIFQTVSHMNYWMDYELRRIRGEAPAYPTHASESWPVNASPANESHWKETVALFRDLLSEFAVLAQSTPDVLARTVANAHPNQAGQASSAKDVLWQMVAHNSYHAGQIALLRRAFDAWPPKGGGDTW